MIKPVGWGIQWSFIDTCGCVQHSVIQHHLHVLSSYICEIIAILAGIENETILCFNLIDLKKIMFFVEIRVVEKLIIHLFNSLINWFSTKNIPVDRLYNRPMLNFKISNVIFNFSFVCARRRVLTPFNSKFVAFLIKTFFEIF